MVKFWQFIPVCLPLIIFVVTIPIIFLATKPFVSLQYALLPSSVDQKIMALESLTVLISLHDSSSTKNRFTSIKQSDQILPLYTALEVDHLVDVKKRFDVVRYAAVISFVLLLFQAFTLKLREFARFTYQASLLGLLMVFATGALLLISWNWLFVTFHEVLFPAGNWSFSETSGLIQLFPEIFWFRFGLAWVGMILLLLLTSTLMSKRILNRTSFN